MKNYRVLIAGAGQMGRHHARTVLNCSALYPSVTLTGVADKNPDALVRIHKDTPGVPLFWLSDYAGDRDKDSYRKLSDGDKRGIGIVSGVADALQATGSNTLSNVTNNDAHIPVLKDAFTARTAEGAPMIKTVFQEKPFAVHDSESSDIVRLVREYGVGFSLNTILLYSPVWSQFSDFLASHPSLELLTVACSYGKDRTRDTRPAIGGWAGMDGIHAIDILSSLFETVRVSSVSGMKGFLAPGASPDGTCVYALTADIEGRLPGGRTVPVFLEGSFAWESQVRRVQHVFKDHAVGGDLVGIQLDFDVPAGSSTHADEMNVFRGGTGSRRRVFSYRSVYDTVSAAGRMIEKDKLFLYYDAVFSGARPKTDLAKAVVLQKAVDRLGRPDSLVAGDAAEAPKKPSGTSFKIA